MSKKLDLTGQRFGYLVAIKPVYENGKREWLCQCDCGNTKIVEATKLKSGHNTSCGLNCSCKTLKGNKNFKGNHFRCEQDFMIGTDVNGNEFYIDKEDYDFVSNYCWSANMGQQRKALGGYYFCARMSRKSDGGHKMKMLQNFIWEQHYGQIPTGYIIDHINLKPFDCRLSNLRLANRSLNGFNSKTNRNSNTGIVGVTLIGEHCKYNKGKYRAYININGKRKELGVFRDKEVAILKRLKAELDLFGQICPNNVSLYEEYKERLNDQ